MPTIKEYYGIVGPVPFVDVEIAQDNRLYVDPHAIRLRGRPEPFASHALRCIDTFFHQVTRSIIEDTPASRAHGRRLLQRFTEPWETRLGMAKESFHGHGGAEDVGTWIWNVLTGDAEAAVRVGVLRHVEDLPLFVEGVDRDITSDITTRIIFSALTDFTEAMIEVYPQFRGGPDGTGVFEKQVWDPSLRAWRNRLVTLPIVDGKALLLVPQGWARPALLMSARRFYGTTVLSYAQLKQAVVDAEGKLLKPSKKSLRKQSGLRESRLTNRQVTMEAIEDEHDLLEAFKAFVALQEDPDDGMALAVA
ncbi:hypothetical protein [Bogoriella caseilytica]|uniref:Uncharacterized protein n=1 Tax=Bogoriella caseilytica TaxID=56055 RepID=A0A3N2BCA8_9MICO|nr:hypothetical protein [Bogoriella caseilytica]ROR72886.1 hypothetical protein EDD31_1247 [Bogoriella caseilytica]